MLFHKKMALSKLEFVLGKHFSKFGKSFSIGGTRCAATFGLQLPPCDHEPKPYKGPSYDEMVNIRSMNLHPSLFTFYKKPLLLYQGHMQYLYDHEGKRYLDLFAGIVTVSVGHSHPKVTAAVKEQMDLLWHTTNIYMHPRIHEYAQKLTEKLPDPLKVVYFVNSGSEANDMALLMSLLYTGKNDVVALRNGYHGMGFAAGLVTAHSKYRHSVPQGMMIHHTMNPDVFRGPWGGSQCRDSPVQTDRTCDCSAGQCKACDMYVDQLEDVLRYCTPKSGIAAFIAETIQGVGGAVQYPKDYLKRAYDIVKKNGGLCISDEVQTGFGRLGDHYWGFESAGVMPDIVTMAKGMGNGFPIGAVVTTPEIASSLTSALHFNTFGGNPMSSAVGMAVLEAVEEDGIQENCKTVGTYFLKEMEKLKEKHEVIGDVRGKGLMTGIELVKEKGSTTALSPEGVMFVMEGLRDCGVLVGVGGHYGNALRIKPPMCITKADIDFTVKAFDFVLSNLKTAGIK